MTNESFREQVERVQQMSRDTGETWDLSPSDQAALKVVLIRMSTLDEEAQALAEMVKFVIEHSNGISHEAFDKAVALLTRVGRTKGIVLP